MVVDDQPRCFTGVAAAVSSISDGQMQLGWSEPVDSVVENRRRFLSAAGCTPESSVLLRVVYSPSATYDVIRAVSKADQGAGMAEMADGAADCLVTTTRRLGLFLPVADCIPTIVHDPQRGVLALVHLGRHSTVAHLATKLIAYLEKQYDSGPKDLLIWMGPSIQGLSYKLDHADFVRSDPDWNGYVHHQSDGYFIDMQGFNYQQFTQAGVPAKQITRSLVDTATADQYWSHQRYLADSGQPPPRFAVVCAIE